MWLFLNMRAPFTRMRRSPAQLCSSKQSKTKSYHISEFFVKTEQTAFDNSFLKKIRFLTMNWRDYFQRFSSYTVWIKAEYIIRRIRSGFPLKRPADNTVHWKVEVAVCWKKNLMSSAVAKPKQGRTEVTLESSFSWTTTKSTTIESLSKRWRTIKNWLRINVSLRLDPMLAKALLFLQVVGILRVCNQQFVILL